MSCIKFSHLLNLIFCVICISPTTYGQSYALTSALGLLKDSPKQLVRKRSYVLDIKSTSKATITYTEAITYFRKPDDLNDIDFVLSESKSFSKIRKMEGKIFDASGNLIRETKKSDVKKYGSPAAYEFTDSRYKILNIGSADPPFTIEYSYVKSYDGFFMMPDWTIQRLDEAIEETSYEVYYPSTFDFKYKAVNADCKPKVGTKNNKKTWKAVLTNLSPIKSEEYNPYFKNIYRSIQFTQQQIEMDGNKGKFASWEDFSAFSYALNKGREQLSTEQAAEVKSILAACNTSNTQSKINCLYAYLQEHFRYVSVQIGVGGWQTMKASAVMEQKYGDCKALSHLMKGMLAVAGIPAYAAWVYGGSDYPTMDSIYTNDGFNHCILYIPREDMWLECTSQNNAPGYLGTFTESRPALLLKESGGKLVQTPSSDQKHNKLHINATAQIDKKGTADINISYERQGLFQENDRRDAAAFDGDDLQKKILKRLDYRISTLSGFELSIDPTLPKSTLSMDARVRRFALKSGKRMFLSIAKLDTWERDYSAEKERSLPFELDYGYSKSMNLKVQLPPNFKVEVLPEPQLLESPFGTYNLTVTQSDASTLIIERNITMYPVYLEPSEFQEANEFFKKASKVDKTKIILIEERA